MVSQHLHSQVITVEMLFLDRVVLTISLTWLPRTVTITVASSQPNNQPRLDSTLTTAPRSLIQQPGRSTRRGWSLPQLERSTRSSTVRSRLLKNYLKILIPNVTFKTKSRLMKRPSSVLCPQILKAVSTLSMRMFQENVPSNRDKNNRLQRLYARSNLRISIDPDIKNVRDRIQVRSSSMISYTTSVMKMKTQVQILTMSWEQTSMMKMMNESNC